MMFDKSNLKIFAISFINLFIYNVQNKETYPTQVFFVDFYLLEIFTKELLDQIYNIPLYKKRNQLLFIMIDLLLNNRNYYKLWDELRYILRFTLVPQGFNLNKLDRKNGPNQFSKNDLPYSI